MLKKINFYLDFYRLAKKRSKTRLDYLKFQSFQAKRIIVDLIAILKVDKNSKVIDLGCGNGGYTLELLRYFKNVKGVDYYVEPKSECKKNFIKDDVLKFKNKERVNLIFCSSVIEHIKEENRLLRNIYDNLKDGGKLYLSFPPFYSFVGGHQLKPFHYFPERIAIWIGKKLGRIDNSVTGYNNLWKSWGLYKRHIFSIKRALKRNRFVIIKQKVRFSLVNFSVVPILGELLTWHVEFYCKKI